MLAVNINSVFLVAGLDNDFSPRRVERYLAAAWESGASPVVVLNKLDLCPEPDARLAAIQAVAPHVPIHLVSALRGDGIDELRQYCSAGQTVALLGSSGVGKSTLINRFIGADLQPTRPVRQADGRGTHTTTSRELLLVPGGGALIDTPGLRELQLWDDDEGVQTTFDEIETLARACHFRDCRHVAEPGCAVREAVEQGALSPERLASLHKLQRELSWSEVRIDTAEAQARKRHWKTIHKAAKRFMKESPKHQ